MIVLFTQIANSGISIDNNVWIIGITQEPSIRTYYDVLCMQYWTGLYNLTSIYSICSMPTFMIGVGGYGTVYTAKYKN